MSLRDFPLRYHMNAIQTNMDKQLFSYGVFIDLKRTFDTADHNNVLHKLDYYGFRGVINRWLSSYLQGQTQTTQIGPHQGIFKGWHYLWCASRFRSRSITFPPVH